ncbi:hypothetical protein SNL152K_65 [Streptomyces sp. NL15-2K]|nr:hypothetical protein SNL152K_65 [Streptomyces sp. NL15-2K]
MVRGGQADDQAGHIGEEGGVEVQATTYGSVHSASVSKSTDLTHWHASSLRTPPVQPELTTAGCSGVASGGACTRVH